MDKNSQASVVNLISEFDDMGVVLTILPHSLKEGSDKKGFRISMADTKTTKTYRKDFMFEDVLSMAHNEDMHPDGILYAILLGMKLKIEDERPNRLKSEGEEKDGE